MVNTEKVDGLLDSEESPPPPCPTSSTPPRNGFEHQQNFNNSAFDNQMYNMEEAGENAERPKREKERPKGEKGVEETGMGEDGNGKKVYKGTSSNESSPYKDINLHG